jgi:inner membrane transporter RhtA
VSETPPAEHDRVPAPVVLVASATSMYLGAAVAVRLFPQVGAPEVAWLRTAVGAVLLVAWRRPWRERWSGRRLVVAAAFGIALAAMNVSFYMAIDRLPLGTAVALEFLGPVAVAAVTGRTRRERAAIAVATVGVVLLAGVVLHSDLPRRGVVVGLVSIGLAATFWAAYIVLGRRVAVAGSGVTTLSLAMGIGALVLAPALAGTAVPALADPVVLGEAVAVAVLSSVLPYALDQVVLRRVGPATFSVLLALLPATATAVGVVVLRQLPTWVELAGLVCVSIAIVMTGQLRRTRTGVTDLPAP